MTKLWMLTRVLLKSSSPFSKGSGRRKNAAMLAAVIVLLPVLAVMTGVLMKAYDLFHTAHLESVLFSMLLTAACMAMVLFGALYVLSTYYFSDDTMHLLTMPIPPQSILAAKFAGAYLYQFYWEALILLPGVIAFGVKAGNLFYWVVSVILFFSLPLIPTVICSVISLLLMAFSKFFRNKDRLKVFAGLVLIIVIVGINVGFRFLGAQTASSGSSLLSSSTMMKKVAMGFPSNILAVSAMFDPSALRGAGWLLLFLFISAAAVAVFLLLGSKLYLRGVIGLTQSTVGKRRVKRGGLPVRRRSAAVALAMKDWRILCRTPAFFLNNILSALVFPPLIVLIAGFSSNGRLVIPHENLLVIAVGVLVIDFLSIMNMVSPTAVSREGGNAFVARYIPVPYKTQVFAKLIPGLAISFFDLLITVVPLCLMWNPDLVTVLTVSVLGVLSLGSLNAFGLFLDILFPKLDWDDETAAVKRNLNVGLEMLILLAALGLPVCLIYLLKPGFYQGAAVLLLYHVLLFAAAMYLLFQKGAVHYVGEKQGIVKPVRPKNGQKTSLLLKAAVIVAVLIVVFWEGTASTHVQVSSGEIQVTAGIGEAVSFPLSQIKKVYLKNDMPQTSDKVGFQAGDRRRGTFNVDGLGRGSVYTETGNGPFLYVLLKTSGFVIFNFSDAKKTNALYEKLKGYAPS